MLAMKKKRLNSVHSRRIKRRETHYLIKSGIWKEFAKKENAKPENYVDSWNEKKWDKYIFTFVPTHRKGEISRKKPDWGHSRGCCIDGHLDKSLDPFLVFWCSLRNIRTIVFRIKYSGKWHLHSCLFAILMTLMSDHCAHEFSTTVPWK